MPGFDVVVGSYTLIPNPFWGGVLFPGCRLRLPLPLAVRSSGARPATTAFHNLLDRPRDNPWRTAIGAAFWPPRADRLPRRLGGPRRRAVRTSATRRRSGSTACSCWSARRSCSSSRGTSAANSSPASRSSETRRAARGRGTRRCVTARAPGVAAPTTTWRSDREQARRRRDPRTAARLGRSTASTATRATASTRCSVRSTAPKATPS